MIDCFNLLLATATTDPSSAVAIDSVWDFIIKGGLMMIPIGLCSMLALAVFVERLIALRRIRVVPPDFLDKVNEKLAPDGSSKDAAMQLCESSGLPVGRVLATGIKKLGRPVEQVEKALGESGEREVLRLRKYLRLLSVIAAVSPLMGLLGTILGMIKAFQTVAASPEALGKTELLAGGIYEAMITTAAGLIVAIPVLIAFHYISSRIERLALDLDHDAVEFVDRWALPLAPGAAVAAPAPREDGKSRKAVASSRGG